MRADSMNMPVIIPERLAATCRGALERRAWMEELPNAIRKLQRRWSLTLEAPLDSTDVSCSWVAPVMHNGRTRAVLKLAMPHMEGQHEIQALRFKRSDHILNTGHHFVVADSERVFQADIAYQCHKTIASTAISK